MLKEKEFKTTKIEIRLTPTEKEQLRAFAEKRHCTMSEAIKWLCYEIFNPKEEQ
jgi:hypothetical protein